MKLLAKKIIVIDDGHKWFIPDFVEFQYGTLNANNRAHQKAIFQLKKFNLIDADFFVKKGVTRVSEHPMVKVEEEVKDKVEVEVKEVSSFKVEVVPKNESKPVVQVSMLSLLSVEACIVEYFNNNIYAKTREQICMSKYVDDLMLKEWAEAFNRDLISRGDLAKTLPDWMKHFKHWLGYQDMNKNPITLHHEQKIKHEQQGTKSGRQQGLTDFKAELGANL